MIIFMSTHSSVFLIMPVLETKNALSFLEQLESLLCLPSPVQSTMAGLRSSQWELTKCPEDPNNHPSSI